MTKNVSSILYSSVICFGFFALTISAKAGCTQPSGTYVGSGSGLAYSQSTGSNYSGITSSLSVNFTTKIITDVGKVIGSSGIYSINRSFTLTSFNSSTCIGYVTLSNGDVYSFTSASSGTIITFSYYKNDGLIYILNFRLDKV